MCCSFQLLWVEINRLRARDSHGPVTSLLLKDNFEAKRDEFWETAPAFEGRKEIWDALRAAAETEDHTLAQAIVDGANITLPTG